METFLKWLKDMRDHVLGAFDEFHVGWLKGIFDGNHSLLSLVLMHLFET